MNSIINNLIDFEKCIQIMKEYYIISFAMYYLIHPLIIINEHYLFDFLLENQCFYYNCYNCENFLSTSAIIKFIKEEAVHNIKQMLFAT